MTTNPTSIQGGENTQLISSTPSSSSSSSVKSGREWKSWSECTEKEKMIIIKKIALVVLVAALIAAAGATAGLSTLAMLAVISIESTASFAAIGALAGTTLGLGVGFLAIPYWAHKFKMHRYNKNPAVNSLGTRRFLLASLGFTTVSAAAGAAVFAGAMAGLHAAGKAIVGQLKLPDFSKIELPKFNFNFPQFPSIRNLFDGMPNPSNLPTPPPAVPPSLPPIPPVLPPVPPALPPIPPSLPIA